MSWNSHIDSMCTNGADEASIVGIEDGALWAANGSFVEMSPTMAKLFIKAAKGQQLSDDESLQIGSTKYMVQKVDGNICNMVSKNLPEKQLLCVGLSAKAATFGCKKGEGQRAVVGVVETETRCLQGSGL